MTFDVIVRSRKRAPAVAVELEDPSAVKRYFNDVMSNCLRNFELTCHQEKAIGRARRQLLSLKESDFYRRHWPYLVARGRDLPGPNGS